jgi:hypothetical protein
MLRNRSLVTSQGRRNGRWRIAVVLMALACGSMDSLAKAQPITYPPAEDVPRIYSRTPGLFADLLLNEHATPTRIAQLGDSTSTDVVGAGGPHLNWRRWLWHQYFGHTPATQLAPITKFAGVPPGQFLCAQNVLGLDASIVPDSFLLPGYFAAQPTVTAATCQLGPKGQGQGLFLLLNHNNDNNISLGLGPEQLLFVDVPPAVNAGMAMYATGSMYGSASMIDARNGLRVEVIAASHPNSVSTVSWKLRPLPNFSDANVTAPVIQSGTLFGGAQSLHAPVGNFYKALTPALATLSGLQRVYQIELAGNTTSGQASESAQIIGARFVSSNPRGIVIDSLSAGGFTVDSLQTNFPNCAALLRAIGYDAAWLCWGTNDQFAQTSPAQFENLVRQQIAFLRSATAKPNLPIILESSHLVTLGGLTIRA